MQMTSKENFDVAVSLAASARTASANGTGVDLQNFNDAVFVVIPVSWTDGSHALKIQESDDNTTFTDVVAAQLAGAMPTVAAAGDVSTITRVGYLGVKRYVRAVQTVTGATTGAVVGVHVMRTAARRMPK